MRTPRTRSGAGPGTGMETTRSRPATTSPHRSLCARFPWAPAWTPPRTSGSRARSRTLRPGLANAQQASCHAPLLPAHGPFPQTAMATRASCCGCAALLLSPMHGGVHHGPPTATKLIAPAEIPETPNRARLEFSATAALRSHPRFAQLSTAARLPAASRLRAFVAKQHQYLGPAFVRFTTQPIGT